LLRLIVAVSCRD